MGRGPHWLRYDLQLAVPAFTILLDAECDIVAPSQGHLGKFTEAARQGPLTSSAIWPQPEAANHQSKLATVSLSLPESQHPFYTL